MKKVDDWNLLMSLILGGGMWGGSICSWIGMIIGMFVGVAAYFMYLKKG